MVQPLPTADGVQRTAEMETLSFNSRRSSGNAAVHRNEMQSQSCLTTGAFHLPANPIELQLTMIGFGLNLGTNVVDATEASVRAVQDALSRGSISASHLTSNARPWQAAIKLGVPRQTPSSSTPMHVDLVRVASLIPKPVSILSVSIEVGGLLAERGDAYAGINAACAVVACLIITRPASSPATRRPELAASCPSKKIQNQPMTCLPRPLPLPNALWTHRHVDISSMEMLARISTELHESSKKNCSPSGHSSVAGAAPPTPKVARKLPPGFTASNNRRKFSEHPYTDLVFEKPTAADGALVLSGGNYNLTFPTKLHEVLSHVEEGGYEHIISWQPHGRAFKIHNTRDFAEIVLPRYYKLLKQSSFFRQLNLYGFRRLSTGPDKGAYYHERFLRSMRFLSRQISRIKINGNTIRSAGNPEGEPNFYDMPHAPLARSPPDSTTDDNTENSGDSSSLQRTPQLTAIGKNDASSNRMSFPIKLQVLLDNLEAENSRDIIFWLPHGRSFMVRDPEALVRDIMPKYFRQTQ